MPTILIVGGYGNRCHRVAELLLQHIDAENLCIQTHVSERYRGNGDGF